MKFFDKKVGFTLSEVMITLSLIGALAVMTLSTVGSSVQQRARLAEFRVAYAKLDKALIDMTEKNGRVYNCYSETDKLSASIRKEFGLDDTTVNWYRGNGKTGECGDFIRDFSNHLGATRSCESTSSVPDCYVAPNPRTGTLRREKAYLLDNSMALFTIDGFGYNFGIDVNGRKGPNKWGQDVFAFTVYPSAELKRHWRIGAVAGTTLDPLGLKILPTVDYERFDFDGPDRDAGKNTYQMMRETAGVIDN